MNRELETLSQPLITEIRCLIHPSAPSAGRSSLWWKKRVQEFNQELAKEDRMRIYLGCEFHANMQMSRMLDEGRVSTMADSGYVLVEFSGNAEYSYIEDSASAALSS